MNSRAEKLLAEAKEFLSIAETREREADEAKWSAAERVWQVHDGEGVSRKEIADWLGVDRSTVDLHIGIWKRHGGSTPRPSFAEAMYEVKPAVAPEQNQANTTRRTLREADEQTVEKIVAALPPERQVVVARAAIRSAPRQVAADPHVRHVVDESRPAEDRVEQARRLVRDPEVAEAVHRDPKAAPTLRRASAKVSKEMETAAAERQKERAPQLVNRSRIYEIAGMLGHARRDLNGALDALREIELDDDYREMLREEVNDVQTSLGWLVSFLESGDRSFESALERLLQEGE
jgi:transposase